MKEAFQKKFVVGLNLDADDSSLRAFLDDYGHYIDTVYFSLPLGRRFYTRDALANEFDSRDPDSQLAKALSAVKSYGINVEVTLNTVGLIERDLEKACSYIHDSGIALDGIVCLRDYGKYLRRRFPESRLVLSFNEKHISEFPEEFDGVVFGKEYLRCSWMRHGIIDQGLKLVLLINAGCSWNCKSGCGDGEYCKQILERNLMHETLNQLYAKQSFFPSELHSLMEKDARSGEYLFKISNRPLGLAFTTYVLDAYINLRQISEDIERSTDYYGPFCLMRQLLLRRDELDLKTVLKIKNELDVN